MISSISELLTTIISIICLAINHMALWLLLKCTFTQGQPGHDGTGEEMMKDQELLFLNNHHKPKVSHMYVKWATQQSC